MTRCRHRCVGLIVAVGTMALAATGGTVSATTPPPTTEPTAAGAVEPSGALCGALPAEGEASLSSMADDPAAVAADINPLLSRLAALITATGLADTLNEGSLTLFAPINSAFDKIDPATLEGLVDDTETLAGILTHHVVAERLSSADLVAGGTFATAHGHDAALSVSLVGETLVINGGEAAVLCADVPTANATVYLIDTVLTPPASEPVDTTEPIVETTEPVVEATEPVVEATEPVVEATEPVVEATEPLPETTVAGTVVGEVDDGGQIDFPEGSSATSVEGTTSNQSFDGWSVAGETGQLLEVSVDSAEGNVTFDVFSVDGEVLADDQSSVSVELPADGLYAIEVGTGANSADYTLNVAITG